MRTVILTLTLTLAATLSVRADEVVRPADAALTAFDRAVALERRSAHADAVTAYRRALPRLRAAGLATATERCRIRLARCLLALGRAAEARAVLTTGDAPAPWRAALEQRLGACKMSVHFRATPLGDVALLVATAARVPVVIDAAGLERGRIPAIDLKLTDASALSVLTLAAELNGLAVGLRCGAVVISSKARLAALPVEPTAPPKTAGAARSEWDQMAAARVTLCSQGDPLHWALRRIRPDLGLTVECRERPSGTAIYAHGRLAATHALTLLAALADCHLDRDGQEWVMRK